MKKKSGLYGLMAWAILVLAAPQVLAAPDGFMLPGMSKNPIGATTFLAQALGFLPSNVVLQPTDKLPDQVGALLGGKVFGVQATGATQLCTADKPCKLVFVSQMLPTITIWANRETFAELLTQHGDPKAQQWLSDTIAWADNKDPNKGPRPPLYRSRNLFAGAAIAGNPNCGGWPAPSAMVFSYATSSPGGGTLDGPEQVCVSSPSDVKADEMGYITGLEATARLKFLLQGDVDLAMVTVPDNIYLEENSEQVSKLVQVLGVGDTPPIVNAGIIVLDEFLKDPEVLEKVRALECGILKTVALMKDPSNRDMFVKLIQQNMSKGSGALSADEAGRVLDEVAKASSDTGTLPEADMLRNREWYVGRSGLTGGSDKRPRPLEWDFSRVPTLAECQASK